jgi:phosphoribosylglycinamide formyltransferase-1
MNIAVFASGNGSNFQAIAEAVKKGRIKANLALLVCDKPGAYVLERAKNIGVEVFLIERKNFLTKEDYEKAIVKKLKEKQIGLIALAGYMRIVGADILKAYKNKILNIHPALLPSFKGAAGIKDALDHGVKVTGVTVHFVDEEMDHGPIIMQAAIEVADDDTEESLAKKIHKEEHRIYPEAVRLFVEGRLKIEERCVRKTKSKK